MSARRLTALAVLLVAAAPAARARAAAQAHAVASPFAVRGIVEGAYGRPWTAAERDRVLRWMAAHQMNTYVHAPKDDLYQRTRWRDPYPPDQQSAFDGEIAAGRRMGVSWIPNISPALPEIPTARVPDNAPSRDLCFSCPADLVALHDKFEPFVRAGARTIAVSFDDVAKTFSHPEDLVAYGAGDEAFGRACGDVLSRLRAAFASGGQSVGILTVGADYSGTADTAFLKGLRATLAPGIDVMWTGDDVPANDFTAADARAYGRLIGRAPVVWDNWTDTDTAGSIFGPDQTVRLFLGPYQHRSDLGGAVRGFLLNPANEAATNLLPLATAADYLADPAHFNRAASFAAAVRETAGSRTDLREPLRAFAETMWSSKLDRTHDAPTFSARRDGLLHAYDGGGDWPASGRALDQELGLVATAPQTLAGLADHELQAELAPFEQAAAHAAQAGRAGLALLAAERPGVAVDVRAGRARITATDPAVADARRAALSGARATSDSDTRFSYGWRTPEAFDVPPYPVPANAMTSFLDAVQSRDASWQPQAPVAAMSVTTTVNGRGVTPAPDGTVPVRCGDVVEAVDGAGGATIEHVTCAAPTAAGSHSKRSHRRRRRARHHARARHRRRHHRSSHPRPPRRRAEASALTPRSPPSDRDARGRSAEPS